ncbi:MAG: transposase [Verrucomicrobiae bacterium]|nr:transposase [Verrucomicrobiae bacterium]
MRQRRLKAPALFPVAHYHCMSRVVNRDFVFGPHEREHFVRLLRQYERFCGARVLTFCILSNHFHLLVEVPARPTSFCPASKRSPARPSPSVASASALNSSGPQGMRRVNGRSWTGSAPRCGTSAATCSGSSSASPCPFGKGAEGAGGAEIVWVAALDGRGLRVPWVRWRRRGSAGRSTASTFQGLLGRPPDSGPPPAYSRRGSPRWPGRFRSPS